MKDELFQGSAADRKAARILEQETKASAFDDALKVAKDAPKIARENASLKAENQALKAQADRPVNVTVKAPEPKRKRQSQVELRPLRLAALAAYGGMKQSVEKGHVHQHIADLYNDRADYQQVIRDATAVATTTNVVWGGMLVESMTKEFVKDMAVTSVAAQLMARSGVMGFNGANSITWPMRAGGDETPAAWVQESGTIPVTQASLSSTTLTRHKMAAIACASEELVRTSNPAVLDLIEQFVREDTSTAWDHWMFDPTVLPVAGVRPGSLTNGAPNQASAGNGLSEVIADLKWLRSQMSAAKALDPCLCMHTDRLIGLQMLATDGANTFPLRDEIERTGGLFGFPILHSTSFDFNNVVAIDAARTAVAMDGVSVDTSSAVTLAMASSDGGDPKMDADGTPQTDDHTVSTAGSIQISDARYTSPATEVRSMFQTNSVAIRLVMPMSYTMIKPSVAYLTAVQW